MACVGLVRAQLARGYAAGNQSGATHFSSYARAVLGPLPPRSIFLINNDQMVRERKSFDKATHCWSDFARSRASIAEYGTGHHDGLHCWTVKLKCSFGA